MGDDFATVVLTRRTWAAVFLGQMHYLYSLVLTRNQEEEGSKEWNLKHANIREAITTFMPVLKEASMVDPVIDKQWFEFKVIAGIFPMDSLVDNAKELVNVVQTTAGD